MHLTMQRVNLSDHYHERKLPPLNWLRSFKAAARFLNLTQAATELRMTQVALSQQINGLESQLGCALFKRLPRTLELTDSGQAYIPGVHKSFENLALMINEIFGKNAVEPSLLGLIWFF
jgi:LysR family glycine cleavage system transcriptional activator